MEGWLVGLNLSGRRVCSYELDVTTAPASVGCCWGVASPGRWQGRAACAGDASATMNLISSSMVKDDWWSAKGGQDSTGTEGMSSMPWGAGWYHACSAPSCHGVTKCSLCFFKHDPVNAPPLMVFIALLIMGLRTSEP